MQLLENAIVSLLNAHAKAGTLHSLHYAALPTSLLHHPLSTLPSNLASLHNLIVASAAQAEARRVTLGPGTIQTGNPSPTQILRSSTKIDFASLCLVHSPDSTIPV